MAAYNTDDFLSSVRQRGSIPATTNANNVNNTANLLKLGSEELIIKLLPLIMSAREELYTLYKDYTVTANQANYVIPSRASGMVLRDLQYISGTSVFPLHPVDRHRITSTSTGTVRGYYLQHNNVVLYQTPATTGDTLRMVYYLRPSRLAATTDCAQITAINTGTLTVTVGTVPSTWGTGTVADFVRTAIPNDCPAIDQTIASVTSTTITFSAALPTDLVIGDWVALAQFSPIPQVPYEFQPVLAQMTVVKALEAIGDAPGLQAAQNDLALLQKNALQLITPRNHSEPRKVLSRNWLR